MTASNTYGRQVVLPLTNKSGGSVIAGDVVVVDTANNDAFTTTTSAGFTGGVGIAQETIANNATGRILLSGYAALVNVDASVTRGHFGKTFTVAKQATDAGATRGVGTFCQFLTGGTTPDALVYPVDLLGSSLTNPMTTTGDIIYSSDGSGTPAALAAASDGDVLTLASGIPSWAASGATTFDVLGTTSVGGSDETTTASRWWGKQVTPANAGLILSISAHVKGTGGAVDFGPYTAILSDSAGAPANILALNYPGGANGTGMRISGTYRWIDIPIGYYAAASTAIWIVWGYTNWDTSNFSIAYATSGSDYNGPATSVMQDSSVSAPSTTTRNYSLKARMLRG